VVYLGHQGGVCGPRRWRCSTGRSLLGEWGVCVTPCGFGLRMLDVFRGLVLCLRRVVVCQYRRYSLVLVCLGVRLHSHGFFIDRFGAYYNIELF
jgi:hypothetical protein